MESDSRVGRVYPSVVAAINRINMDTSRVYAIRVEGHLGDQWSDWFEGMMTRQEPNGETTLSGTLSDQAALYGVLTKIHNLNLILVSIHRSGSINED